MNKLILFFDLFRKGSAVTDPKLWKDRTALTLALTGVILAIVKVAGGLGYAIPISETEAATLAAAVAIAVGLFSTFATSDKVGVLPPKLPTDSFPPLEPAVPEPEKPRSSEPFNAERGS
jgi:hypothetical protein